MNEVIKIGNQQIAEKEFNGQRVVTFKDIDSVHERPEGTARKRFNDNKEHFVEGEDYFVLKQPSEIRTLGLERPQGGVPEKVTVVTESGYLMLVKSFTDDLAWKVQRQLVDGYFRQKETVINRQQLSPQMQMLMSMVEAQAKQELEQKRQAAELEQVKENQKAITQALAKPAEMDFRSWVNSCLSTIAESEGFLYMGNSAERHRAVRAESYERLNQKRPCRLEQRVTRARGEAATAGATKTQINAISKLSVIDADKDLKPVYESVIREMLVAYKVNP